MCETSEGGLQWIYVGAVAVQVPPAAVLLHFFATSVSNTRSFWRNHRVPAAGFVASMLLRLFHSAPDREGLFCWRWQGKLESEKNHLKRRKDRKQSI